MVEYHVHVRSTDQFKQFRVHEKNDRNEINSGAITNKKRKTAQKIKFSKHKSAIRQFQNFTKRPGESYADAQPNALVIHTIDFISVIFPCTPTCLK